MTKFQGLQTVFEGRFENLTPFIQKMRVIKSADEIQKMIVAGDYADKAVNIGFDNISLDVTETDIIAQIEFGIKKLGYEMSFETMVLTGNNAANPRYSWKQQIEKTAFFSSTWLLLVKAMFQI